MRRVACVVAGFALLVGGCVVTADQEHFRDYNQDGVFLFQHGDFVSGPGQLPGRGRLQPEDPAVMYNLGECYDRLGNLPKAECCFRKCLQRQPRTPQPAMPWSRS